MNTFLTAFLVELLDPLPATAGLGDSVQRARRHLTGQIEAGGLVRYHGLPDGPGIGTLGCAITPDTDDTALVWRLAPGPDRRRLSAAQGTLPRPLAALAVLYPIHLRWSLQTLAEGLTYASIRRLQARYRALYALVGLAMVAALFCGEW